MILRMFGLLPQRTAQALREMVGLLVAYRAILVATTRVEFAKRYAGSVLGLLWVAVQPLLFLGAYLFVFLVVFKIRFPGYSDLDYVLYVFSGLVPFLALMDAITQGVTSIKQNIHLIKNVVLPIDLVPVRVVAMSLVTQIFGLVLVAIISVLNGALSPHILFLPVALIFQTLFLLGVAWIMAALGVLVAEISYLLNAFLLLVLFLSPIAFLPDALSPGIAFFLVKLNPVFYMTELFRFSMNGAHAPDWWALGVAALGSVAVFAFGCLFFRQFKNVLVDYE